MIPSRHLTPAGRSDGVSRQDLGNMPFDLFAGAMSIALPAIHISQTPHISTAGVLPQAQTMLQQRPELGT